MYASREAAKSGKGALDKGSLVSHYRKGCLKEPGGNSEDINTDTAVFKRNNLAASRSLSGRGAELLPFDELAPVDP